MARFRVTKSGQAKKRLLLAVAPIALAAAGPAAAADQPTVEELQSLSIEELGKVDVYSVSRRNEPLSEAPASAYVITSDAIRRSGATSLPEVLRLAPNVIVARLDARGYAISIRGFNSYDAANKLLVLIDGRSIYTTLHGGVLWDQNTLPLSTIDRIEVVSGPAGAMWGANAFGGMINIVTKSAAQAQGALLTADVGTVDQQVTGQYGGQIGDAAFRVYGTGLWRGETVDQNGDGRNDDWNGFQTGFRIDWAPGKDSLSASGDYYRNTGPDGTRVSGQNVIGRWSREVLPGATARLRMFYDKYERDVPGLVDRVRTFDVEGKVNAEEGRHALVFGGGYRNSNELFALAPGAVFFLTPDRQTVEVANFFVQDEIALTNQLSVTGALKYEWNSFSGNDWLPSLRLAYQLDPDHLLWAAVSRGVRTPSLIDRNLEGPGIVEKASDFGSEKVTAYEAGYRGQLTDKLLLSASLYYNDYDDLRILTLQPSGLLKFGNSMHGHGYGVEAWADYQLLPWWRLSAGANWLHKNLKLEPTAVPVALDQHQGNDPNYQLQFRSRMSLTDAITFDADLRAVDDLTMPIVPSYVEADARIAWRLNNHVEVALTGNNLLHAHHPETGSLVERGEVRRSVTAGLRLAF